MSLKRNMSDDHYNETHEGYRLPHKAYGGSVRSSNNVCNVAVDIAIKKSGYKVGIEFGSRLIPNGILNIHQDIQYATKKALFMIMDDMRTNTLTFYYLNKKDKNPTFCTLKVK